MTAPRVLVVYGSRTGHTVALAERVAETIRAGGSSVDVYDVLTAPRGLRVEDYDGVLVAASVIVGRYERELTHWVSRHRDALRARPNGFLSVCLTASSRKPADRAAVQRIVDRFAADTGWHPDVMHQAAGALLYSRYSPLVRLLMQRKVRGVEAGRFADTSHDYDLTDYAELTAFARAFADRVRPGVAAATG